MKPPGRPLHSSERGRDPRGSPSSHGRARTERSSPSAPLPAGSPGEGGAGAPPAAGLRGSCLPTAVGGERPAGLEAAGGRPLCLPWGPDARAAC